MEEIEVPLEHLHEEMHHQAEHASHEARERWISMVALTSALLAVLAAVTALLAGYYSNEAMLEQLHASDTWSHYQSKSIKSLVLSSKRDLLMALSKPVSEKDEEKIGDYKKELTELEAEAHKLEAESKAFLNKHEIFARGVTFFQVAIGIAAVAVLTRRRLFWYLGLLFSVFGSGFLLQGLFTH